MPSTCFLFFDTEFTDFESLSPISLWIVSEDEKFQFYQEFSDYDNTKSSDFVNKIVVPLLDLEKYGDTYQNISLSLIDWLNSIPCNEIFLIADYQGDLIILENLLFKNKELIHKKIYLKILTNAFILATHERMLYKHLIIHHAINKTLDGIRDYLANSPELQHHALNDAQANRYGWNIGMEYLKHN